MGQIVPDALVKLSPRQGLEDSPVHGPLDRLRLPVPTGTVPLQPPRMPAIVRDRNRALQALIGIVVVALVPTVRGAVPRQHPVNRLEDVQLAAVRPALGARAVALGEQPKGGPEALLLAGRVRPEVDDGLDARDDPGRGRPRVDRLDAGRGPAVLSGRVRPGDDLEGAAPGELQVRAGRSVLLQFVVDAQVACDDVPRRSGGRGAGRAAEILGPEQGVTGIGWGVVVVGGDKRAGEGEGC